MCHLDITNRHGAEWRALHVASKKARGLTVIVGSPVCAVVIQPFFTDRPKRVLVVGDGLLLELSFMRPRMDSGSHQLGCIASHFSCIVKRQIGEAPKSIRAGFAVQSVVESPRLRTRDRHEQIQRVAVAELIAPGFRFRVQQERIGELHGWLREGQLP